MSDAPGIWYYEYLDRLANTEMKNKVAQQGGTERRYRAARRHHGDTAICRAIVDALLPRLPRSTVALVTGTGNPVWLPHGETDGPSGVAVLARALAALGVRSVVLSELRFLPGVKAAVQGVGVPLLERDAWRQRANAALPLEFPTGEQAAGPFVEELLAGLPGLSAVFFIEKPGPNTCGVFHNSTGKPKDADWVAHAHRLAQAARARGVLTVGVGDGGNEIGFGLVREQLVDTHRFDHASCGCGGDLLDATQVDFLFPASVSNWGCYAIAAALALVTGRDALLPPWDDVLRSIVDPIACGAFDGYSGLALPSVDGTSIQANRAIHELMSEVIRQASDARQGPLQ